MSLRAAVGRPERLGKICSERDQSHGDGVDIQLFAYHPLVVFVSLINGFPFAALVLRFDLKGFEHTFREAEGGVVIIRTLEKGDGDIKCVGIAVRVLSVKVAVNDKTEIGNVSRLVKCVGYCAVNDAPVAVVVAPYLAVDTVQQCRGVAPDCRERFFVAER